MTKIEMTATTLGEESAHLPWPPQLSISQIYTVVAVDATAFDSVNLSSSPEVGNAAEE